MKKLVVRERSGRYDLENFGAAFAGADGRAPFSLVIESSDGRVRLEFPEASLYDLFTRFDLRDPQFLGGTFRFAELVRVHEREGRCVIEAGTGSLYDFFRERYAAGYCRVHAGMPVRFDRRGYSEAA
jgi:hypothetical protein